MLFFIGLSVFAASVYIFVLTEGVNVYDLGFLILALMIWAISICSIYLRKSLWKIILYLFVVMTLFIAQLSLSIALFINTQWLTDQAMKNHTSDTEQERIDHENLVKNNIHISRNILISWAALTFVIGIMSILYIKSVKYYTKQKHDSFLEKDLYERESLAQKASVDEKQEKLDGLLTSTPHKIYLKSIRNTQKMLKSTINNI